MFQPPLTARDWDVKMCCLYWGAKMCAGLHMSTTQLYPGCLPAEQGHDTTVSWPRAGGATGTAGSGIPQSLLWTTQTSALRLSSSTWLNSLQTEHPVGRDQVKTERCSALALASTPHLWKHHCCTSPRDSCVGQNRRHNFCRAVIIQARKTQEVSHQKEE